MAFPKDVIEKAWKRSGGYCECERKSCRHSGRCNKQLVYENHKEGERGAWEAHHKKAVKDGGEDTLANCEILCLDCHKNTPSYGDH